MIELMLIAAYLVAGLVTGVSCGLISRYAFDGDDAEFTAILVAIFWPIALPMAIIVGAVKLVFRLLP